MKRLQIITTVFFLFIMTFPTTKSVVCSKFYRYNPIIYSSSLIKNNSHLNYLSGQDKTSENNIKILKMLQIYDIKLRNSEEINVAWEWKDKKGSWKKEDWKWSKQQKKSNNTDMSENENQDESLDAMEESYRKRATFFKNIEEKLNELKNTFIGTEEKINNNKGK
jgi:hypothetical protein